jgi:hypothetical protein
MKGKHMKEMKMILEIDDIEYLLDEKWKIIDLWEFHCSACPIYSSVEF